jgi:hypothetical protein
MKRCNTHTEAEGQLKLVQSLSDIVTTYQNRYSLYDPRENAGSIAPLVWSTLRSIQEHKGLRISSIGENPPSAIS